MPSDHDGFTRTCLTSLLDSHEELRDVLVQMCVKLEQLQRTLEMTPERVRTSLHSKTMGIATSSQSMSNDHIRKHKSQKSEAAGEGRSAAVSVSSMNVDMFALNLKHNQKLLSKKKSFSVSNLAYDKPRKGALKRVNSQADASTRRLSQASVKVVAPESEENSVALPGCFRLEAEEEGDCELLPRSADEDSNSVDTVRIAESPNSPAAESNFHPHDARSSVGSMARSVYASVEQGDELCMTPVVLNDVFASGSAARQDINRRRPSAILSVPHGAIRSGHATTMPGGLSLNEDVSNQASGRSAPKSPQPSNSDARRTLTSLDSLRAQHNVKVLAQQSERLNQQQPISEDGDMEEAYEETLEGRSMICAVSFVLSLTGVLDARPGRFWKCLAHLSLATTLSLAVLLLVLGDDEFRYVNLMTNAYAVGVVISVLLLRWGRAEEDSLAVLLGPKEFQLDEYACKRGFIESSRLLGTLRAMCFLGLWALMVASRILSGYFGQPATGLLPGDTTQDLVSLGSYAMAMLVTIAIIYAQLHVASGLELAVDMFSAHFFNTKDICAATDEWNILQALIRCASCRIETSFMVLGASSLATLVLLATELWTKPELLQNPLQAVFWLGWVYPPVLLLLYSLTRAAAVSEKCSRVAPFINSWDFPSEEEEYYQQWLHEGRQYIVQYIMQSEAGFYVKGVRLSNFTVMKLCYGFGALSFALLSHTMTTVLADAVKTQS